jgi:hypothetical protein
MINIRLAQDRGHADHGWLNAWHSFSFGDYYDPKWMGYSSLRVINEDRVAPGTGFAPHGHRDMEIITYVLDGAVQHRDSSGGGGVIRHGEVQVMSAGSGIQHSEKNPSNTEALHLLQIWIEPSELGVTPRYDQIALDQAALRAGFAKVFAPPGEAAHFNVHQDARLFIAWPAAGQKLAQALKTDRRYYLHVARGQLQLRGKSLRDGDAAMLENESALDLVADTDAEVLLFDLA